jgi:hypothetical protein
VTATDAGDLADAALTDLVAEDVARTRLASGELCWVVVSGKMTAGKDTVAPALIDTIGGRVSMLRYGDLMRAELDPALDVMRTMQDCPADQVAAEVADAIDLPLEFSRELVTLLSGDLRASAGTLTAHARTDAVRVVLQNLGDSWRCSDDPTYWARRAKQASIRELCAGNSVILTGGRFLEDVELPVEVGAIVLHLDVSRATQLARLGSRDGLAISADTLAALDHPGETALDDWDGFTVRLSNDDGTDLDTVISQAQSAVAGILRGRAASAA